MADQIVNCKSHNILQLQTTISFEMNHIYFGCIMVQYVTCTRATPRLNVQTTGQ